MRKIAGYLTKNRSGKDQKIAQSTHENEYIKPRKTFWRNSKQFLKYFNRGVEQGIFRPDINFDIINQAMVMQMDLLIYSDMLESYPLVEIYSEIILLHMRGITTRKGSEMVDAFLCQMKEKQFV